MDTQFANSAYLRAKSEMANIGINQSLRPEPTLDQARAELSSALSKVAKKLLNNRYGPLIETISEDAISRSLRVFEENLTRAKGDFTLILEELTERVFTKTRGTKP